MISNYYTLAAVARSLETRCVNWVFGTPFTQRRNELTIPVGPVEGSYELSIVISCDPSTNFLIARESVSRARRNSAEIFPAIEGRTIRAVDMHPSDRILTIWLDDPGSLRAQFFGSRANVFFVSSDGSQPESFLTARRSDDTAVTPPADRDRRPLEERLVSSRTMEPNISAVKYLRRAVPTLGPALSREALYRASIGPDTPAGSLTDPNVRTLVRSTRHLIEELVDHPAPRIISIDGEPAHFSLVPLHHLGTTDEELYEDISTGILKYLSFRKKRDSFLSRKHEIMSAIGTETEKTAASLEASLRAIPEPGEADLLERYGKILHMNLPSLRKGMTSFDVDDPFDERGVRYSIPLEPALSPARNAERYFAKARNARTRAGDLTDRARELRARSLRLREIVSELEPIVQTDDLDEFIRRHGEILPLSLPATEKKKQDAQPPFRVYTVSGGWSVWVGKNSANNDLLTTRHTAKNDLWFHARGVGGSHVVLKAGSGKGEIPKRAIMEAAAIAAHYSKMKNARHVAVSMCEGKFVRKPRKAPPGTVTIEREEVLFVDPFIPSSRT